MAFFETRFCDSHHSFDAHVGDQGQEQVTCVTKFTISLATRVGAVRLTRQSCCSNFQTDLNRCESDHRPEQRFARISCCSPKGPPQEAAQFRFSACCLHAAGLFCGVHCSRFGSAPLLLRTRRSRSSAHAARRLPGIRLSEQWQDTTSMCRATVPQRNFTVLFSMSTVRRFAPITETRFGSARPPSTNRAI